MTSFTHIYVWPQEREDKLEDQSLHVSSCRWFDDFGFWQHQEEELERLRVELNKQREEEAELEQKVEAGRSQLETVLRSIDGANNQVNQVSLQPGYVTGVLGPPS